MGFVYRPEHVVVVNVRMTYLARATSGYSVWVRYRLVLDVFLAPGVRKRVSLVASGAEARGRRGVDLRVGLVLLLSGLGIRQGLVICCTGSLLIFIKKFEKNSKGFEKIIEKQYSGGKTVYVPDGPEIL